MADKRKLNCKSIVEKYKILKEVEQGHRVVRLKSNPSLIGLKDKSKIFAAI